MGEWKNLKLRNHGLQKQEMVRDSINEVTFEKHLSMGPKHVIRRLEFSVLPLNHQGEGQKFKSIAIGQKFNQSWLCN